MRADGPEDEDGPTRLERARVREEARARLFGALPRPVRLDRFELRSRLGAGATGVVYAAFDPKLEREVAIKVLTHLSDWGEMLLREARALARLAHPNVLSVHEVGADAGVTFIVSELVAGGTLRAWIGIARSHSEVLDLLFGVAQGLAAGHAAGLSHRDVKPENVLVGLDGRPRISDFGLANTLTGDSGTGGASPLPGTRRYMAPEQRDGVRADTLSDQYSFAVMAFEVLTGRLPFPEPMGTEDVAESGERELRIEDPRLTSDDTRVLRRALSVEPERRYPSMSALLLEWRGGRNRAPFRRRFVGVAVGVAVFGLVVTAGLLASREPVIHTVIVTNSAPVSVADEERAIALEAMHLTQAARWDECARYLAPRAKTDALMFTWLGCARAATDKKLLDAACEAWSRRPGDSHGPTKRPEVCAPTLVAARHQSQANDAEGCVLTLLGAPPTREGYMELSLCISKLENRSRFFKRLCEYQEALEPEGRTGKCNAVP